MGTGATVQTARGAAGTIEVKASLAYLTDIGGRAGVAVVYAGVAGVVLEIVAGQAADASAVIGAGRTRLHTVIARAVGAESEVGVTGGAAAGIRTY